MSEFIEPRLIKTGRERDEVARLIQAVFLNDEGQRLLRLLVSARNPFEPRFDLDHPEPLRAAFRDGQSDVVQFLWRHGTRPGALPEPEQPQ